MYKLFWPALLGVFLSSCSQHYFYAPNTLHLPTVREKGDATIEASLNGSNQIKGGELRAAYCPLNNTSVMLNYMYMKGSFERYTFFTFPTPPPEQHSGRGFITDLGITRNFPISEYSMFTLTAGGSLGRSVNDYSRGRTATLNFNRLFVQPAIVSTGKLADFGIGLRFSRLHFYDGKVDYTIDGEDIAVINNIDQHGAFLIPDIGLSAGVNFAPVHVKCNMTLSVAENIQYYSFTGNNLSVSVLMDLDNLVPQKKKSTAKEKSKKSSKKKKSKKKKRH